MKSIPNAGKVIVDFFLSKKKKNFEEPRPLNAMFSKFLITSIVHLNEVMARNSSLAIEAVTKGGYLESMIFNAFLSFPFLYMAQKLSL